MSICPAKEPTACITTIPMKLSRVIEGSGHIVHRDGSRTKIEKGSVALSAKYYYDIKNTGDSVMALLGNRAEGFGGPTIYLDAAQNEKMKTQKQFSDI